MKSVELKINHLKPHSQSYITDYLQTLGIAAADVPSFIDKPREEDEENPENLDNIDAAVQTTWQMMNDLTTKVFVQVDSDTDGYTSAAILINYFRRRFPAIEVVWRLHHGKEHGLIAETVPADCNLVFIPDAGSNDIAAQEEMVARGAKVIVLDHHEINHEGFKDTGAIIVNNQESPRFKNKNLSGAGVVYKFIKLFDRLYYPEDRIFHEYGDLAAIGIIADAMNMTSLDNNYIAYYGLSNIHSKFIHAVALRQARGISNPNSLTKIDVAFYIAPVINGVIRSGASEDKEMVFRAMTEENCTEDFEREWRGTTYHETLYDCAARMAANAKSRQDSSKKKSFEWLKDTIILNGWDKHNIIIVPLNQKDSTKVSANITGLIAMELVKYFNKPVLVLRDTVYEGKEVYGGSGRNGTFFGLKDLRAMVNDAGALYSAGHANAFGVFLQKDQPDIIRNYFDEHLDKAVFDNTVYEVDYWFGTQDSDYSMLSEIADYSWLWGNSIPQPKIAVDVDFTLADLTKMGKSGDSLRLRTNINGVNAVSFSNPELIEMLESYQAGPITIVGRPQNNEWNGRKSVQLVIDDVVIGSAKPQMPTFTLADLI